jgi:predicted nucleic acid-binding protein
MERGQELVVDASIALKWFVEEIDSEKALMVLDHISDKALPIVPSLFFYEIANVLRYKSEFGIKDIQQILQALSKFGFIVMSLENEIGDLTIELAYRNGITVYDASYLAISSIRNCEFVTSDERLYNKLSEGKVILLKEWI